MRAVVQRVSQASVAIDGVVKGAIGGGLLILLAVEEADNAEDIDWLSGKIVRLRIFDDEAGVMNRSVREIGGEILLISQFTLFASMKKRKSSFLRAFGATGNCHSALRKISREPFRRFRQKNPNRRIRRGHESQPRQ